VSSCPSLCQGKFCGEQITRYAATVLRAEQLSKIYPSAAGDVTALSDFTHTFQPGQITAIMGPSGSGKSTLLNVLAGLDTPSSGGVFLAEASISRLSESERADLRLKQFGFVFQSFNLIAVFSALQNVAFPIGLAGVEKNEREKHAKELLERFGLGHRLHTLPHKLSGGERQRVALARALANNPDIIFADEPTGNLDSKSGQVVLEALRDVASEGRTVILVTHDIGLSSMADTILEMRDGALVNRQDKNPVNV
jgi:putative ABC transport system ATP-binding protein